MEEKIVYRDDAYTTAWISHKLADQITEELDIKKKMLTD